ncbi:MAG: hypothetical protein WA960_20705, partial [Tunicatimonas sp.]
MQEALVLEEVRRIKAEQSQLGTEKVHLLVSPFFVDHGIKMGRAVPAGISCMICCVRIIYYPKENEEDRAPRSLNIVFIQRGTQASEPSKRLGNATANPGGEPLRL